MDIRSHFAMKKHLIGLALLIVFTLSYGKARDMGQSESIVVDDHIASDDLGPNAKLPNGINLDGISADEYEQLSSQAEKHTFQAEVNRMMKLIINSLYKNKEIFLRELISNASDALDKIRLLSLTDPSSLDATDELSIRIKVDKDNRMLHITDTGIGMTKDDLIKNLGTIAKSGTAEFLSKLGSDQKDGQDLSAMIGQFGVGFYSAFLVADKVVVTTKNNADEQLIWESDANSFSIVKDPRGSTLKRGAQITLKLKEEALDYLELDKLKELVRKYSQFINFPIYLWTSKVVEEEVPLDEEELKKLEEEKEKEKNKKEGDEKKKEDKPEEEDEIVEDAKEDEEKADEKPKTKKIEKTVWDWQVLNDNKPIWTKKPSEVSEQEYYDFYKALTHDYSQPLAHTHFIAEGEVSFKSLLFVPRVLPSESFNKYATVTDNIKLYVRRVFITDEFTDLLPKYLSFIKGLVDSDDLPLNVSRETLQQHKLLKVIKKKLIRKIIDMLKKLDKETYDKFWAEYSTNIKLGMFEDTTNRARLAHLLRFQTSSLSDGFISLKEYISLMKPNQDHIYYIAGASRTEVEKSPFVEKLLRKGYEVLFLVEPVDEYSISSLPEYEGKKFQNVAKEGLSLTKNKKKQEQVKKQFEPLITWLADNALKDMVSKVTISERLTDSPCALVAGTFGWTGNMERLAVANAHQKASDPQREYYLKQKKTLEINPKHAIMKELLTRVSDNPDDPRAKEIALMMFRTATLRSGYMLQDSYDFALAVETMMKQTLGIPLEEKVDEDDDDDESGEAQASKSDGPTDESTGEPAGTSAGESASQKEQPAEHTQPADEEHDEL